MEILITAWIIYLGIGCLCATIYVIILGLTAKTRYDRLRPEDILMIVFGILFWAGYLIGVISSKIKNHGGQE